LCFITQVNAAVELRVVATSHKILQYQESGQLKGSTAEIFKLLMQEAKLPKKVEFYPWPRTFNIASTTPNVMILSIVRTKERESQFIWLLKVSELVRAFISLKSQPQNKVGDIAQAKTKLIAVVRDSYSHTSLINNGFSEKDNLYLVASFEDAMHLFIKGRVDLLYVDPIVIKDYYANLTQSQEEYFDYVSLPETRRDSYIAMNKLMDKALVNKLQQATKKVEKQDNYQYFLRYKPFIDQK
jgi:ABC-type amino acid transport substrate-binding protein